MVDKGWRPDGSVLIAMPERFGLPRVPSDKRRCHRCGASVWVSKRAADWTGAVLCVVCGMAVVRVDDIVSAAPWVLADLEDRDAST